jgi:Circularly permutated YpsA SLOG family
LRNRPAKIISGGQTGADRAALDFALERGIATGGYVPHGRLAEDGRIPDGYVELIEASTADPAERTELNVRFADATLIFSYGELRAGSRRTAESAKKHNKPFLHLDLARYNRDKAVKMASTWLSTIDHGILNVAGPRASEDPAIYDEVIAILEELFMG